MLLDPAIAMCDAGDGSSGDTHKLMPATATMAGALGGQDGAGSQQMAQQPADGEPGPNNIDTHADCAGAAAAGGDTACAAREAIDKQPTADVAGDLVLAQDIHSTEGAPGDTTTEVEEVKPAAAEAEAEAGAGVIATGVVQAAGEVEAHLSEAASAAVAETVVPGMEPEAPAAGEPLPAPDIAREEAAVAAEGSMDEAAGAPDSALSSVTEAVGTLEGEAAMAEAATRAPADEAALQVQGAGDHACADAGAEREAATHAAMASVADSEADIVAAGADGDAGIELGGNLPDGAELADFFTDA